MPTLASPTLSLPTFNSMSCVPPHIKSTISTSSRNKGICPQTTKAIDSNSQNLHRIIFQIFPLLAIRLFRFKRCSSESPFLVMFFFCLTKCVYHVKNLLKFSEYTCREDKLNKIDNDRLVLHLYRRVSSFDLTKTSDDKRQMLCSNMKLKKNNSLIYKSLFFRYQ